MLKRGLPFEVLPSKDHEGLLKDINSAMPAFSGGFRAPCLRSPRSEKRPTSGSAYSPHLRRS